MISLLLAIMSLASSTQEKPTLIYIGDPMCSWCYGISPQLDRVKTHFKNRLDMELVNGGLRPYNQETMADLKDFLKEHWQEVHEATGQPFSYGILDSSDLAYDTEPPARAVVIFRDALPQRVFEFFKEVQKAFYLENKNMFDVSTYTHILETNHWLIDDFAQQFASDRMKSEVRKDFQKAEEMGATGFPTVLLRYKGEIHPIAKGYSTAEKMIRRIENVLSQ